MKLLDSFPPLVQTYSSGQIILLAWLCLLALALLVFLVVIMVGVQRRKRGPRYSGAHPSSWQYQQYFADTLSRRGPHERR